jgi:hypothetical protein
MSGGDISGCFGTFLRVSASASNLGESLVSTVPSCKQNLSDGSVYVLWHLGQRFIALEDRTEWTGLQRSAFQD